MLKFTLVKNTHKSYQENGILNVPKVYVPATLSCICILTAFWLYIRRSKTACVYIQILFYFMLNPRIEYDNMQ